MPLRIADRVVDGTRRAFIIAEIAQAHDGSLGQAHAFIDAIADAGADAVKFQTHIAEAESTLDEPFRIPMSGQDATRRDYWARIEFAEEQWVALAQHASERGLVFLSSAFSVEAVEMLDRLGMAAWKIGSGEVRTSQILDVMAATGRPLLLSTGMSPWSEIDAAVSRIQGIGAPVAIFQCTSRYPTALEQVGLNVLDELRTRYAAPVGLSDHSATIYPAMWALAHNADLIEVHVTFDRAMYGPDTAASLNFTELATLCAANNAFETFRSNPVSKDAIADELAQMRELFNKSVAVRRPLAAGTLLTMENLTLKKPGTGIPAEELNSLVGRRLTSHATPDRVLRWEDIDQADSPADTSDPRNIT